MRVQQQDEVEVSCLYRLRLIFHVLNRLESVSDLWAPSASLLFGKDSLQESVVQLHRNSKNLVQPDIGCMLQLIIYLLLNPHSEGLFSVE